MPQYIAAAIKIVAAYTGSTAAATVIVYGSMAIATGYVAVKTAESKAKRAEEKMRTKARNRAQEIQNMQFGTVAPRRFIYGQTITNGHLVFQEAAGTDNKELYRVLYLGEGPIENADQLFFNEDQQSLIGDLDNTGAIISTTAYNGYAAARVGLNGNAGSASYLSSIDLVGQTSWTANHKMTGNAWLAYKLIHNNEVWTSGVPNVRVRVLGRKVYDPRLDSTNGGSGSARYNDETTWGYSNNSAICVLDFLINGMKVDIEDLDIPSFVAAANTCDDDISIEDASGVTQTQKRYTTNGVAFLDEEVITTLEELLIPCHGSLIEEGGTIRLLVPGASTTVTANLTEDDLISELSIKVNAQISNRMNKVGGSFTSAVDNYQEVDFSPISSSALIADDGREHIQELSLAMVTSEAHAQRMASIVLKENALTNSINVNLKPEFAYLRVGDIVTLTFQPEVIGGTGTDSILTNATKFQVTSYSLQPEGEVAVELQEYSDASYTWNTADHNYVTRTALSDSFIDTIAAPTLGTPVKENFLDQNGNQVLGMCVPVTHGSHPNFVYTEVKLLQHRYNSSNVLQQTNIFDTINAGAAESTVFFSGMSSIPPFTSNTGDYIRYSLSARTNVENGKVSAEATKDQNYINNGGFIAKDTTAPAAPTSASATSGKGQIFLTWTNPTDLDFDFIKIYRHTSNAASGRTEIGTVKGTIFVDSGLPNNVTRYYWITSIDKVGNESAFVGPVSANTNTAEISIETSGSFFTFDASGPTPSNQTISIKAIVQGTSSSPTITATNNSGSSVTLTDDTDNTDVTANYVFPAESTSNANGATAGSLYIREAGEVWYNRIDTNDAWSRTGTLVIKHTDNDGTDRGTDLDALTTADKIMVYIDSSNYALFNITNNNTNSSGLNFITVSVNSSVGSFTASTNDVIQLKYGFSDKLLSVTNFGTATSVTISATADGATSTATIQKSTEGSKVSGVALNGAEIPMNNGLNADGSGTEQGVDPRPNNTSTQAKLDEAFLETNPLLSSMSDIPEDAVVWGRFVFEKVQTFTTTANQTTLTITGGHTPDAKTKVIYDTGSGGASEQLISGDFTSAAVDASGNSASITLTNQFFNRLGISAMPSGKQITVTFIQASARKWDYSSQNWTDNAQIFDSPVVFSPLVLSNEVLSQSLSSVEVTADQLIVNKDVDLLDGAAWRIGKTEYSSLVDGIFFGNPSGTGATNYDFAFVATSNSGTSSEHGIEITPQQTKLIQPVITKQSTGAVAISDTQTTSSIVVKSGSENPDAQTVTINAIGGGGGGAGAESQSGSAGSGGDTVYTLTLTKAGQSNTVYSNVTASGGAAGTGYGAAKTDGDAGEASARASGGYGGGAYGVGGTGSLGSGGGGGGGRDYNWNTSSRKGGGGGSAGSHISNSYDISNFDAAIITIASIGAGGTGMSSSRGNGGAGGAGVLYGTIETQGLDPVFMNTARTHSIVTTSRAFDTWYLNTSNEAVISLFVYPNTYRVFTFHTNTSASTTGSTIIGQTEPTAYTGGDLTVIVPAGQYYSLRRVNVNSGDQIKFWGEYK